MPSNDRVVKAGLSKKPRPQLWRLVLVPLYGGHERIFYMQVGKQVPLSAVDNEELGARTGQRGKLAKQLLIRALRFAIASQSDARALVQVIDRRV